MTCLERLKQEHPDYPKEQIDDIVRFYCPSDYGYLDNFGSDRCDGSSYVCIDCWNRVMEEK